MKIWSGRVWVTASVLADLFPSSKRDCKFIKKSAMFESLLRIGRTTKKSVIEVICGSAKAPRLLANRACLTADSGSNFQLETGNKRGIRSRQTHRLIEREVFVHTRHTSANITQALVPAVLLCVSSQIIRAQVGVQTQSLVVHGTPRTCSSITQLDSALSADYRQFFDGWTEKDYGDAIAWSQACSEYGWHIRGRPRIPLLLAQRDRALGSAQTQIASSTATAGALPSTPVQTAVAAPTQAAPGAAMGSALPSPSVQAAVAAPAQTAASAAAASALPSTPVQAAVAAPTPAAPTATTDIVLPSTVVAIAAPTAAVPSAAPSNVLPSPSVQSAIAAPTQATPSAATGNVLPSPAVRADIPAQAQNVPSAATGDVLPSAPVPVAIPVQAQTASSAATSSVPPIPHARNHTASEGEEDSLLADNFFKEHFHQESLWVADKANLDIGDDGGAPSGWSSNGIPAQMKNRLTADRIVLYCARKTNSGESGKRPLLWDLRWCEAEEASAYKRLVSGNEFPTAGRGIVLGCAGVDSYVHLERCVETLTETGKR